MSQTNHDEIVRLVEQIRTNAGLSGSEHDQALQVLIDELERRVPHPYVSDLIFWPDLHGFDRELSADEIADLSMSYMPAA